MTDLELKAGVDDKATPAIKKIGEAIKGLSKEDLSKLQKQFDRMGKSFGEQHKAVTGLRKGLDELKAGFNPLTAVSGAGTASLAAFGVGAFSLVGIMAGLKDAIIGVAEKGKALSNTARVTGMSTDALQTYQKALDKFGISGEQVVGTINLLGDAHTRLQKNIGWSDYTGPLRDYGERIKNAKDAQEELRASFEKMNTFKDIGTQRTFAAKFMGNADYAGLKWSEVQKMAAEAAKTNLSPDEVNKANLFDQKWADLGNEIDRLKNTVGLGVIPALEQPIKDLGDYLNAHEGDITNGVTGFIDGVKQAADAGQKFGVALTDLNNASYHAGEQLRAYVLDFFKDTGAKDNPNIGVVTRDGANAKRDPLSRHRMRWHPIGTNKPAGYDPNDILSGSSHSDGHGFIPIPSPGSVISGAPADPAALAEALRKKSEEIGSKLGDNAGDALTKPGGPAEKFGKQAGKSLAESFSNLLGLNAQAGELQGGAGGSGDTVSSSAGGVAIKGARGGGYGRRRMGGGAGGSFDAGTYSGGLGGGTPGNAKRLMDFLVTKHGWTPAAAAVAAAQANAESSFRPGAFGDRSLDNRGLTAAGTEHGSWGMFQWNRQRLAALQRFGGKNWKDFDVQAEFFAREAERMLPNWKHIKDLQHANALGKAYEGYRGPIQPARAQNAARFLHGYSPSSLSDAVRSQPAHPHTVTPSTPTGTVNVHITGDRKDKVSVNGDGMFKKISTTRRFFNTQQEVA